MKTVLITGASRGIGAACARAFSKANYRVLLNYLHSRDAAFALAEELNRAGGEAIPMHGDVSVAQDVEAMFSAGFSPQILVNNAGIAWQGDLQTMPEEAFDKVMAVNLKSAFLCSRAALRTMLARHEGCILNISSVFGVVGGAQEAAYSAAKAGMIGLTRALAKEVGPNGVRVNCVAPGVIDTDMNAMHDHSTLQALADRTPLGRLGTPEEVADAVLFLAQHPFITGEVLHVGGGFAL